MQVLKCTRKNLDPAWVKNEIQKILKILIKTAPHKIYLFGSANENRMTDQSDFDFLLVFESSALIREGQKNLRPFYPLSEFSVDLVWTTEDEFEKKKRLGGICFVVHNEGTLLYERKQNQ